MAETTAAPSNIAVNFKGKRMAKKSKDTGANASPKPAESDKDWEAEDGLRTMQRAEQHQNDPDMMKRIGKVAQQQSDALGGVMAKLQKRGLVSDNQAEKLANRRKAVRT